jgi:hypothetical protein
MWSGFEMIVIKTTEIKYYRILEAFKILSAL